jgi:hypothetical protein
MPFSLSLLFGILGGSTVIGEFAQMGFLLSLPGDFFFDEALPIGSNTLLQLSKLKIARFEMAGELFLLTFKLDSPSIQFTFSFSQGNLLSHDRRDLNPHCL